MLEEKLDLLTKETVALRQAVEANTAALGGTAGAPAAEAKPARGRPATKKEVVEPTHNAEEVETIIRSVSKDIGRPVALKIIKGFKGCEALADLLTHPEFFDAAFEQAEAAIEAATPAEEEEEDI